MSIDPHGRFGPLGKYGQYGRVGSVINLIGSIGIFTVGTVMMLTRGFPSGLPVWFALLWWAIGAFVIWRTALIFRSVRRRERETAESERLENERSSRTQEQSPAE